MKKILFFALFFFTFRLFGQEPIRTFKGHIYGITSVCFSPDGKTILSGSLDNTLKIWDIATGKNTFLGNDEYVWSVCFSPNGKTALSGGNKTLKLWDIPTGQLVQTFLGHSHFVRSVCFSPDGKMVLSGSGDKTIKLWDTETGKEIYTFLDNDVVEAVSFSPDGKMILSAGWDKTCKLWDIENRKLIRTFLGHSKMVKSACFDPNGKTILSASEDRTLKLWDVATGKEIRTFLGHGGLIYSACFSPHGKIILSGSHDNTLKLWEISSDKEILSFLGHDNFVQSVCFSPDGKTACSGSYDATLKLWNVNLSPQDIEQYKQEQAKKEEAAKSAEIKRQEEARLAAIKQQTEKQYSSVSLSNSYKPQSPLYHKGNTAARVLLSSSACGNNIYVTTISGREVAIRTEAHHQFTQEGSGTGYWMDIYDFDEPVVKIAWNSGIVNLSGKWGSEYMVTFECREERVSSSGMFSSYRKVLDIYRLDSEKPIKEIDDAYFNQNCQNGTSKGCAEYLSRFESGAYRQQAAKLKEDKLLFENIRTMADCNKYLQTYPKGVHVSEVRDKITEFNAIAANEKQIKVNTNKALWKIGNKICLDNGRGVISGVINQWNEDKSMAQIKVLMHPGGSYDGNPLSTGVLMWVEATGKGWHICTDREVQSAASTNKGDNSCYSCQGRGTCEHCLGSGFRKCSKCDGKGVKEYGRFCSVDDGGCNGKQQVVCWRCSGNKKCTTCGGRGKN